MLNITDRQTERLAAKVAAVAGESKTRAVKMAPKERKARRAVRGRAHDRRAQFMRFLKTQIWRKGLRKMLGRRTTKREVERILGYGPDGV